MDLAHSLGAKGSGEEELFILGLIKLHHESFDRCSSEVDVRLRHHFFVVKLISSGVAIFCLWENWENNYEKYI